MGKPYQKELAHLRKTYEWALSAEIATLADIIRNCLGQPLIVVGSGGSLTAAEFIVRMHEAYSHQLAKSLTPLEFALHPVVEGTSVLILSAGGRNRDILQAVRHAITDDYETVAGICATIGSAMGRLLGDCRHASVYEFEPPSGKDGFLATNSLLATCVLAARAYRAVATAAFPMPDMLPALDSAGEKQWPGEAFERAEYRVLVAGWSAPVGLDLESKIAESGLGSVSVTDFRNFAHGRHNGVARRLAQTTIISLETPEVSKVAARTQAMLPADLAHIQVVTTLPGPAGTLDLLVQVYDFIGAMGAGAGIDPGRPQVPDFGRRLYRAGFAVQRLNRKPSEITWLKRKVSIPGWESVGDSTRRMWRQSFRTWSERIRDNRFGAVVLDYDGTLCEPDERFSNPSEAVGLELNRLLDAGVLIGIATGRGGSALDSLRNILRQEHWPNVSIGLYNGGQHLTLDQERPEMAEPLPEIAEADALLRSSEFLTAVSRLSTRHTQITVEAAVPLPAGLLRRAVEEHLFQPDSQVAVRLFQSGHSIDVIPQASGKRTVVSRIRDQLDAQGQPDLDVLTVGDQGRSDGNDFELLAGPWGLSVERTSTSFRGCWNLGAPGERRTRVLLRYLAALRPAEDGRILFHLDDFLAAK